MHQQLLMEAFPAEAWHGYSLGTSYHHDVEGVEEDVVPERKK
jgi:hypothetical protein